MAFPADRCSGDFLVAANNPSCPTTFRPSAISDSHRPGANFVARNFPDDRRFAGSKERSDWRGSTFCPSNEVEASSCRRFPRSRNTKRTPRGKKSDIASLGSRRLAARQKIAHAVERLENVLGRVGVGQPHVALAQDAEVRAADDG